MGSDTRLVAGAVVVVAALAGGLLGAGHRSGSPSPTSDTQPTAAGVPGGDIKVHVAGWVHSPGVVTLVDGSIVADAVAAAGGLRPGAQTQAINLAAPVGDGHQVVVPGPEDLEPRHASGDGTISLNQASAAELEGLPGVGPVLAQKIVDYREQNGAFREVEDLLAVPGIGEAKLASIRDLVRLP